MVAVPARGQAESVASRRARRTPAAATAYRRATISAMRLAVRSIQGLRAGVGRLRVGRDLERRLVWLFGSPPSGSTWLWQLRGGHNSVVAVKAVMGVIGPKRRELGYE